MANSTVARLTAILQLNNTKFKKGLTGSQKALNGFSKQVQNIGGAVAAAFSVRAIVGFTKEAVQLASKMEGVRTAFYALGQPGLLDNLRKATRGTVTDLQLMQKALQAKNFKIPLEQLATYFEFATSRAIQTGESVDYLVDSIITGIGRKSVLVMDNLGISAAELQEEVKKVGDFGKAAGNIIEKSLQDAGDVADTLATRIAQITTAWENFKTSVGNSEVITWFLRGVKSALENISGLLNRGSGAGLTEFQEFSKGLAGKDAATQQKLLTEEIDRQRKALEGLAKQRREQIKLTESDRRVVRKFAETEIEKLDTIQTPLIEILRFFEGQLEALTGVNGKLDDQKLTQDEIFENWVKINDALREQMRIKEELRDLDIDLRNETLGKLAEIGKGATPMKGPSYDAFANVDWSEDETLGGGAEKWEEMADGIGDVSAQADKLGNQIGMMLVNQVDALGVAIGEFASGAEGSFKSLGNAIMQNLGNILIMMGAQTGNIPLVLAGVALQLGGGILRGMGSSPSTYKDAWGRTSGQTEGIKFRVEGKDLVAALDRNSTAVKRFT